ncbi:MAG: serine/threonine-protein kinase [Verrucomicrobiales bacterium]|nr:serine/threonine-protein kinase [Verrucomicrobiales bacterium]
MSAPDTNTCPTCDLEIPSAAPGGMCPKCLLEDALPPTEETADDDATVLMESPPALSPAAKAARERSPGAASPPDPKKGAQQFAPPVEELSKLFPELEILELLGAGGMGAVYQARQPRLDRLVALKILSCPAEYHDNFALRFEREAQLLAKLSHPNIVTLYDFGEIERTEDPEENNLFYFMMEYVDGADLSRLIHDGGLEPDQALRLVPQICDALQFAHDEGITHRDIKPANILVDKKGNVRIADFGLAKLISAEQEEAMMTGLTMTGTSMGTPHYMAPEQWEAPEKVDHRADIYSLGVVFYEMLTGSRPHGIFTPPSQKTAIDDRIDTVVLKAMEKEPELRYQQASQVKEDVTRVVSEPVEVVPASKNRTGLWIVVALALLAIIGLGIWWQGIGPGQPVEQPETASIPQEDDVLTQDEITFHLEPPRTLATMRERGGRLRFWSEGEIPVRPDLRPAEGLDDLVALDGDTSFHVDEDYRWMARRGSGGSVTAFTGIPDPDRLVSLNRHHAVYEDGDRIRIRQDASSYEWTEIPGDVVAAEQCIANTHESSTFAIFLKRDGNLILQDGWLKPELTELRGLLQGLNDVVKIDAEWNTAAALRANGELIAWNDQGEIILPDQPLRNVVDIVCAANRWLALDAGGQVHSWQDPELEGVGNPPPQDLGKAYAIAAFGNICAAQMADGSWRAWMVRGNPQSQPLVAKIEAIGPALDLLFEPQKHASLLWIEPERPDIPVSEEIANLFKSVVGPLQIYGRFLDNKSPDLSRAAGIDDFSQVILTESHWVALRKNGTIVSSDDRGHGKTGVKKLLQGRFKSFGWIDEDGKLTIVGDETGEGHRFTSKGVLDVPQEIQSIGVVDAEWETDFAIARLKDGTARVWGERYSNPAQNWLPPWPLPLSEVLTDVIDIATTNDTTAVIQADGSLHAWSDQGMLDLSELSASAPFRQIETGWGSNHLLCSDGTVYNVWNDQPEFLKGWKRAEKGHMVHGGAYFSAETGGWKWIDSKDTSVVPESMKQWIPTLENQSPESFCIRILGSEEGGEDLCRGMDRRSRSAEGWPDQRGRGNQAHGPKRTGQTS